jgi:hypothetical protein
MRGRSGRTLSDADWSIYRAMKKVYTPPRRATVRVDTSDDIEKGLAKIAAAAFPP